jgi:hypothetical protein
LNRNKLNESILSTGDAFSKRAYQWAVIVLSFALPIQLIIPEQIIREELWLTNKNARTHHAPANRRRGANTAALRAKAPATRSNSIAIAVTKSVREISKRERLSHKKAQKAQEEES